MKRQYHKPADLIDTIRSLARTNTQLINRITDLRTELWYLTVASHSHPTLPASAAQHKIEHFEHLIPPGKRPHLLLPTETVDVGALNASM